ncbi:MAG TPA: hypothetical protein VJU80_03920 [Solirubrobacteraceae bacterium]|nr:hypothetical protein [Solirubrobacteraceae bacterium]
MWRVQRPRWFKARDAPAALELELVDHMRTERVPVLSLDLSSSTDTALRVVAAAIRFDWTIERPGHKPVKTPPFLLIDPTEGESEEIVPGEALSLRYSFEHRVLPCPIDCGVRAWARARPASDAPWQQASDDPEQRLLYRPVFASGGPVFARWAAAGWRFQAGPPDWPPLRGRHGPVVVQRSSRPRVASRESPE